MHSDWLSPVLQIVQNTYTAKRNRKMSLLKSLSQEGLEEMATASAKAPRRYWALEKTPPTLSAKCQPIRSDNFKWNCVVDARAQSHDRDIMEDRFFSVTSQITLDIKRQIKQINMAVEKFA